MREFLITKFVCSKCGSNLRLTYDAPKGAGLHNTRQDFREAVIDEAMKVMDQTKGIVAFWASVVCANIWAASNTDTLNTGLALLWTAIALAVLVAMKGK